MDPLSLLGSLGGISGSTGGAAAPSGTGPVTFGAVNTGGAGSLTPVLVVVGFLVAVGGLFFFFRK